VYLCKAAANVASQLCLGKDRLAAVANPCTPGVLRAYWQISYFIERLRFPTLAKSYLAKWGSRFPTGGSRNVRAPFSFLFP
jgi:hypothetical protein